MILGKYYNLIRNSELARFYWLFGIYLVLSVLFFRGGYRGELVDDGLAGLVKFENQGWKGFGQSFGFTSLYYFHDFFVLTIYALVGKSAFGWFIVMIILHSLNAWLSFITFRKFYYLMNVSNGTLIAFTGAILFLLSPYQTENVLWAATLHYSVALSVFLVVCNILLNSLQSGQLIGKTVWVIAALYAVSLMTLEISLVFPLAWLVLGAGVVLNKKTSVNIQQFVGGLIFPLFAMVILYFIATRLIKGHWLPHYGETHLLNNDIKTYSTNFARYLIKTLGFVHFASYSTRDLIYTFCEKWQPILVIEISIPIAIFFLLRFRKKLVEANTFLVLVAIAFIMLLPSLHMFFMYLFNTQNDRLGYYFSLALYQLVALVLVSLLSYVGLFIIFTYGLLGLYFLHQQVIKWNAAGVIQDNCIRSFVWTDAPKVYVLNETTYFNGAYVFRNDERLLYALDLFREYKHPERIVQIFSSCSDNPCDSTMVEVKNDSTLHVEAITGGWLMHESVGATDYSTDEFYTKVDKWGPGYEVFFRHKQPGAVYIYLTPYGFRQLNNF